MKNLIEASKQMAVVLLEKYNEFYPFAFGLTYENEAINIATLTETDTPEPQEVIEKLNKALSIANKDTKFKAVCICVDILFKQSNSHEKTDALQLRLNFRDTAPIDYIIPYKIINGKINLNNPVERQGKNYMNFDDY